MRNVIWGAGYYASLFTVQLGRENVDFYIDKDRRKSGKFLGKDVIHPDDIREWNGLHIYVPYNYYDEISAFLKSKGLVEDIDFTKYTEEVSISKEEADKEFDRACREVETLSPYIGTDTTAWLGYLWATKKEYRDCIASLTGNDIDILVLANTPWYISDEVEAITGCHAIVMPKFMADFVHIKSFDVPQNKIDKWERDDDIRNFAIKVSTTRKGLAWGACLSKAAYCKRFIEYLLKTCKFKNIIIGGSDDPINVMVRTVCEENELPMLFTHQGILPGTIMMGPGGDIGDSMPAVHFKAFCQLPVADTSKARKALTFLFDSKANRKTQPKNHAVSLAREQLISGRPTVLCMGQNDLESSMIPYTEKTRIYQSPIFKTSIESAVYIANICKRHDWNMIYKPHPMFARFEDESALPDNVIFVQYGDVNDLIDLADVVVTIRSSVNYIALIRHKPVLMLGYTQTRGQGCTYEAFREEDIEQELCAAVAQGFTEEQQKNFVEHVARLLDYYLYDDMSDRPIRYGLSWPKDVDGFFDLERRLKAMEADVH